MFLRLVYESFRRQKRRKVLAAVSVMLGVAVATAMLAVATGIGDKISRELRSYGANILVTPKDDTLDLQIDGVDLKAPSDSAYLDESDLPKIKGIFWHNNIVGFAPMLPVSVELNGLKGVPLTGTYFAKALHFGKDEFSTGVEKTHPYWKIEGRWPADDSDDVLVGARLASRTGLRTGSTVNISGRTEQVVGILQTGSDEDNQIFAPLHIAQQILGKPGAVRSIYVSAVTKPEDALARRDPKSLGPVLYDRWYCSPYAASIAFQLEETIPHAHAAQIRQVAQNEGVLLSRIQGLMWLVTIAALAGAALAVSAAMAAAILERKPEVGLMKALGARSAAIAALLFTESTLLALVGGTAGFLAGMLLARKMGTTIFGSEIAVQPVLYPIMLAISVLVAYLGSALAIGRASRLDPAVILRGDI